MLVLCVECLEWRPIYRLWDFTFLLFCWELICIKPFGTEWRGQLWFLSKVWALSLLGFFLEPTDLIRNSPNSCGDPPGLSNLVVCGAYSIFYLPCFSIRFYISAFFSLWLQPDFLRFVLHVLWVCFCCLLTLHCSSERNLSPHFGITLIQDLYTEIWSKIKTRYGLLLVLEFHPRRSNLNQTLGFTIILGAWVSLELVSPHMEHFMQSWCIALSM